MRKLSADYIFTSNGAPIKNGVITVNDGGQILSVGAEEINSSVEVFKGFICPGFINSHCHLELSHLKGKIPEGTGLDKFIMSIEALRKSTDVEIHEAIICAEQEMFDNGIVAVGDISNGDASFFKKGNGKLRYHTFIEVFGFHPARAESAFSRGLELYSFLINNQKQGNTCSIAPHAPYSESNELLKKIADFAIENQSILTIHNQESEAENELFLTKTGLILKRLEAFGIDISWWQPTGKNSLPSILPHLPSRNKTLFVHNTVTTASDIEFAEKYNPNTWWCFCPITNLYIENKLPDFSIFKDKKATIGTDSLASNRQLSILEEIKIISKGQPDIPLEKLIQWATINGAQFLEFDSDLGSIESGKTPGLNLIENVDVNTKKILPESSVRRLI